MALPLQSIVSSFLQSNTDWRKRLVQEWPTMVGDLHTKMRLERIGQDSTVVIGVYDIHWMHELHMLSPLIMQTINEKLGSAVVKKIRFIVTDMAVVDVSAPPIAGQKADGGIEAQSRLLKSLTTEQQKTLAEIKDPHLQAAIAKLWKRST